MAIPDRVVSGVFAAGAWVRRNRVFHPTGMPLTGALHAVDGGYKQLLGSADRPVVARISKGVGLPAGIPDVLGLAIRVLDRHDRPWDLVLATTGTGAWSRFLIQPAPGWASARYGSLMPYRLEHGPAEWIFAEPDASQPETPSLAALSAHLKAHRIGFILKATTRDGGSRTLAEITIAESEIGEPAARPGFFDPVRNRPPEVELLPRAAATVREWAYAGSRRGRGESDAVAEQGIAGFQGMTEEP